IFVYERSVKLLSGSYKLWKSFWEWSSTRVLQKLSGEFDKEKIVEEIEFCDMVFERAAITMARMPRFWLDWLEWSMKMKRITKSREIINLALQSLVPNQHDRLWDQGGIVFARAIQKICPLSSAHLWKRR